MNWYKKQLKMAVTPRRKITTEDIEKIKDLLEQGYNNPQIAKVLSLNKTTIGRLIKKYNLKDYEAEISERDKSILNLYLLPPDGMGLSARAIERKYGFHNRMIFDTLDRLNLLDKWRSISEEAKKRHRDNPELAREHSEFMKQRHIDNPELAKEHSQRMIEWWKQFESEDGGKLENRLLSYPTRQQAVNHLRGFVGSQGADQHKANAIYNAYIKVINDHTYPDEIQHSVVASMNWYKKAIGNEYSTEIRRRMPETSQQLYDYYYGDDPPFEKEDYLDYKMRDVDLAKPPDEMSPRERGAILNPDDGDIGKSNHKIDDVVGFIMAEEGKINEEIINKYLSEFDSLNLPLQYVWNYIRNNYELV